MENIDPNELAKFASLAGSWWDTEGDCRPLHDLNPCRGEFIASRADLAGARILDVGCGGGILSEYLAAAGAIVTGIDVSEELIAVARLHALQTNTRIDYLCTSIEELSTTQHDRYDVVTCLELLEHVPDPEHMVRSCARQLNKDGEVFFSTINRTSKAYALAVFGAEYLLKLLPRGTHDYTKFIKPSEMAKWARAAGLETREFRGLNYNPLSRQARLRDDLTVNYIAHFSAPQ